MSLGTCTGWCGIQAAPRDSVWEEVGSPAFLWEWWKVKQDMSSSCWSPSSPQYLNGWISQYKWNILEKVYFHARWFLVSQPLHWLFMMCIYFMVVWQWRLPTHLWFLRVGELWGVLPSQHACHRATGSGQGSPYLNTKDKGAYEEAVLANKESWICTLMVP